MTSIFDGKKVLVTGGVGSLGKEVVKNLLLQNVEVVRVFDIDETKEFELQEDLGDTKQVRVRFLLGDLRDKDRLARAIEDIDIVVHTAALKHVVACEYNPFEAIKTNVLGTQNLIDVAINEEVDKVIFTSSDKATNPSNTMGATKLLAEKLMIAGNYYKGPRKTKFACVRFGNVLGTRGSLIPLIKNQIKDGKKVTLTYPDMTRYVITQAQAIDFIFNAVELMKGGEVFILKMPVIRTIDLIEVMIETLGTVYRRKNIEIEQVGVKPGEKMYEELITEEEATRTLETKDMYIILPQIRSSLDIDYLKYHSAKPAKHVIRTSKDAKPLSKREIKDILTKEKLLEA